MYFVRLDDCLYVDINEEFYKFMFYLCLIFLQNIMKLYFYLELLKM